MLKKANFKNVTEICLYVAKKEGKKKQMTIAQIREVVGILSEILFDENIGESCHKILVKNGKRRFLKRLKSK